MPDQPICVKCQTTMRCDKNAVWVRDPAVGPLEPTYWCGDRYKCHECGAQIITGFGKKRDAYQMEQGSREKALLFYDGLSQRDRLVENGYPAFNH